MLREKEIETKLFNFLTITENINKKKGKGKKLTTKNEKIFN